MSPDAPYRKRDLAARFAFFVGLWLMIAGWSPKDLPVGVAAAAGAVWISLVLAPPGDLRPHFAPLVVLVFRFLRGSIVAGLDVARRALAPRIDIEPGFVACPLTIPPGFARNAFCLHQSLQPGSLPTGAEGDRLMVHALDMSQPIAARLAEDEALFDKALLHE
ncbi:Na+/H+ antiporter subunit E [Rhodoblastus sp.]|uniref:Na+/H+ antiporter subunit E n=1 Tax=Rhodoblastus sp. TaxID=1962975 RepID=UPI0035B071FA